MSKLNAQIRLLTALNRYRLRLERQQWSRSWIQQRPHLRLRDEHDTNDRRGMWSRNGVPGRQCHCRLRRR